MIAQSSTAVLTAALIIFHTTAATAAPVGQLPPPIPVRVLFNELAKRCGSSVHHDTLQAVARVESKFNPYAIGVVRGALPRQPRSLDEAVRAAQMLHAQGKNFSMGLMQVNKHNLRAYRLNYETVFDPCRNIQAGSKILEDCFVRAGGSGQAHLQKAFSCYYSGNFRFGFRPDFKGQPSYVNKVLLAAADNHSGQTVRVPAVNPAAPVVMPAARKSGAPKATAVKTVRTATAPAAVSAETVAAAVPENAPAVAQPVTQPQKPPADWDVFGDF